MLLKTTSNYYWYLSRWIFIEKIVDTFLLGLSNWCFELSQKNCEDYVLYPQANQKHGGKAGEFWSWLFIVHLASENWAVTAEIAKRIFFSGEKIFL